MDPSPRRTVPRTLLWFCAFAAVPLALRPRERAALRALFARPAPDEGPRVAPAGALPFASAGVVASAPPEVAPPPLPAPWRTRRLSGRRQHAIEDPCVRPAGLTPDDPRCEARAMDAFYRRLDATERGGALARVAHIGDSVVADDKITRRVRARLQQEFGDGGVGFVLLRPPSRFYELAGVRWESRNWGLLSVVGPRVDDGVYGLSGVAFTANDAGPQAEITVDRAEHVELAYRAQAGGGALTVRVDQGAAETVSTGEGASGYHVLSVPAGAHTLTVRAAGGGPVRVYGAAFERAGRGVVVDNLGVIGNSVRSLLHADEAQQRALFAHRAVDLYLFLLGTNDASHGPMGPRQLQDLEDDSRALYRRLRAANPGASCLVMAPPDAMVTMQGELVQRPAIPGIVDAERRAALAEGCAFWNTYQWMGGRGAIERWRRSGWAEIDYTHVSDAGGAILGDALTDALLSGRDTFHARPAPDAGR